MEILVLRIVDQIKQGCLIDDNELQNIIRRRNRELKKIGEPLIAKRDILPFFLKAKEDSDILAKLGIDKDIESKFVSTVRMKPRRSASGVATITVIAKPWPCSGQCIFCPNDAEMPKSYLSDEPACQRALLCNFDPYLQVSYRLKALYEMGHPVSKVELIILGGTWTEYNAAYRLWFVSEMILALNDGVGERASNKRDAIEEIYYQAKKRDERSDEHDRVSDERWDYLRELQNINASSECRCVGMSFETRPDQVSPQSLVEFRRLGCTKVQVGIQSLDEDVLKANLRSVTPKQIQESFELLRIFGFKSHIHFMPNLLGSTPDKDIEVYRSLMHGAPYQPDEVKIYPCTLVDNTPLMQYYKTGEWQAYSEDQLVDLLVKCFEETPRFCRISRVIRDISSKDIVAGNKKVNLRQEVEKRISKKGSEVLEIRHRERALNKIDEDSLELLETEYITTNTTEYFLEWSDKFDRLAGFLRLSLPNADAYKLTGGIISKYEAMIREVHVYGRTSGLGAEESISGGVQHLGLGTKLVNRACEIAKQYGYEKINVISAVGTKLYYEKLGFYENGLYQQRDLNN